MQGEKSNLFALIALLSWQVTLAHGPDASGAGCDFLFHAFFDDRSRV
jgi:hypothetical protein